MKSQEKFSTDKWLTRRKVICVSLVLLVAAYIAAQPTLVKWTGWNLPSLTENDAKKSSKEKPAPAKPDRTQPRDRGQLSADNSDSNSNASGKTTTGSETAAKFALESTGNDRFLSPEGLLYTPSRREHRIEHVMRHAKDIPDRDGPHGVFDVDERDQVLATLDRAYRLIKDNAQGVKKLKQDPQTGRPNYDVYEVDMGKRIGYVGGKSGAKSNHPACNHLRIVLDDGNRVISAFPVRKR